MDTVTIDMCQRALRFAAERHGYQRYPHSGSLPYIYHIHAVALEVQCAIQHDPTLDAGVAVCCALLHDTIEDTMTTREELATRFGVAIATGVAALTKNEDIPNAKEECLGRIRQCQREVWVVKLADRCSNLSNTPPPLWAADRIRKYAEEGNLIRNYLGEASPWLAERLSQRIASWHDIADRCGR